MFGWITPKKEFFECKTCDHVKFAFQNFSEIKDEFEVRWVDVISVHDNRQQLLYEGNHPEWHIYECYESDFNYDVVQFMYKKGYIRVGTVRNNERCYFEGTAEVLTQNYQFCVNFCEERDLIPVFEKR